MENDIEILIFDIEKNNSILNTLNQTGKFSRVYNEQRKRRTAINLNSDAKLHETNKLFDAIQPTVVYENNSRRERELFDEIEITRKNKHSENNIHQNLYDYKGLNEDHQTKKSELKNNYLNYTSIDNVKVEESKLTIDDNSDELKKMIERNREWLSKK